MRNVKHEIPANEAVYTLRVDRATLARIHEIAASEHRTLSGKLRLMIEREIAKHELSPLATSPQVATVAAEPPAATPPGAPDPANGAPGAPTSQSRHEQRLDWTADSQTEVEEECA